MWSASSIIPDIKQAVDARIEFVMRKITVARIRDTIKWCCGIIRLI